MNYTELQSAVVNYFKRGDIAAKIPAWIVLAEAFMFRELDISSLEVKTTGTTSSGLIPLPSDCQSVIRLTVTVDGTEKPLDYIAFTGEMADSGGYPDGYSIQGGSIRIHPDTGDGTAYALYYVPRVVALSSSVSTNWILANSPDLYLYATALQGAAELKNDTETARLDPYVSRMMESTRSLAQRRGQPNKGGMQIKPRRGF